MLDSEMPLFQTPVLFLVFNRPEATASVFAAIRQIKPAKLYLASDGPRHGNRSDELNIVTVRSLVLDNIDWDCQVKTLVRSENLGCKNAVSSAITWFFENEEEGIILEDDCLPSLSFFKFCETLLEKYRFDERIRHISGVNFIGSDVALDASYYFSRFTHVWGWASWRRVWKDYDVDLKLLEEFLKQDNIINIFPDIRVARYLKRELERVKSGELNTWDFQYLFLNLINNGLCIIPAKSLVENIGFGINATHELTNSLRTGTAHNISSDLVHPNFFVPKTKFDIASLLKINDLHFSAKVRTKLSSLYNKRHL